MAISRSGDTIGDVSLRDEELVAATRIVSAYTRRDNAAVVRECDAALARHLQIPIALQPVHAEALMIAGRYDDAVRLAASIYDQLTSMSPGRRSLRGIDLLPAARLVYRNALIVAGELSKADVLIGEELDDPASRPEVVGEALLFTGGDRQRGWELLEHRPQSRRTTMANPIWSGNEAAPVVIAQEGGIGDVVLFARWLPWISARSTSVTWIGCPPTTPATERWLRALGVNTVITAPANEDCAVAVPSGARYVAGQSLAFIASHAGYADLPDPIVPESIASLRQRYLNERGAAPLKVGVCWRGSAGYHLDPLRSFAPDSFAQLWRSFDAREVDFVNLCHGAHCPAGAPFGIQRFADIYETAEIIAALDMVVTVDSAVAHIAGSIGVPTVVLAKLVPDWRYDWRGTRSPFYESVYVLHRQSATDTSVIARARAIIARAVAARASAPDSLFASSQTEPPQHPIGALLTSVGLEGAQMPNEAGV